MRLDERDFFEESTKFRRKLCREVFHAVVCVVVVDSLSLDRYESDHIRPGRQESSNTTANRRVWVQTSSVIEAIEFLLIWFVTVPSEARLEKRAKREEESFNRRVFNHLKVEECWYLIEFESRWAHRFRSIGKGKEKTTNKKRVLFDYEKTPTLQNSLSHFPLSLPFFPLIPLRPSLISLSNLKSLI